MKPRNKRGFKYHKAKRKQKEFKRRKKNLSRQSKCSYCKARIEQKPRHITFSKGHYKKKSETQKRVTFLLGAGAIIPWNGPSTKDIDKLIKSDKKYKTKTVGIRLGAYLLYKLKKHFKYNDGVNFETFMALLESIHDFYKDSTVDGSNPVFQSFYPALFTLNTTDGNNKINIDEFKVMDGSSDELTYFFYMWQHYFKLISNKIAEYSDNISELVNSELSESLRRFIKYYQNQDYIVRIYTTNYDRFIPEIFKGRQKVFDGFSDEVSKDLSFKSFYNPDRILTDTDCLNYYNLHGSIYWRRSHNKGYSFECIPNEWHNDIEPVSMESVNPGHQILPTRIITGYSKLQRTSIDPFNLFLHSFFSDCKKSNEIITIGYSFSDFHINNILAHKFSEKNIKHTHISYEEGNNKIAAREIETFNNICDIPDIVKDPDDVNWLKYKNAKIYLRGFKVFLENEEWKK